GRCVGPWASFPSYSLLCSGRVFVTGARAQFAGQDLSSASRIVGRLVPEHGRGLCAGAQRLPGPEKESRHPTANSLAHRPVMTTTKPGTAAAQLSELRRIRAEMREMAQEVADRNAPVPRRLVPVTGTTPAVDLSVGGLAVLDRKALGRRSLLRLADELALRGAAGLIVSRE